MILKMFLILIISFNTFAKINDTEGNLIFIRKYKLRFENKHFQVPKGQYWKVTWISPYKKAELRPDFDIRVYGVTYFDKERKLSVECHQDFDQNKREFCFSNFLNFGFKEPRTIWLDENTFFKIKSNIIDVEVENYKWEVDKYNIRKKLIQSKN